jgi:hypothetical protein
MPEAKQMNILAEIAADLCRGTRCFFCGRQQPETPLEDVYRFNPNTPLCECLTPYRRMAFDYIEGWDCEEGKKSILTQVEKGTMDPQTKVYQYICKCGTLAVVTAKTLASGLRTYQKHKRRNLCDRCYKEQGRKLAAAMVMAARSKHGAEQGPHAKINKTPTLLKPSVDTTNIVVNAPGVVIPQC